MMMDSALDTMAEAQRVCLGDADDDDDADPSQTSLRQSVRWAMTSSPASQSPLE